MKISKPFMVSLLLLALPFTNNAQEATISLEQAVELALEHNKGLWVSSGRINQNQKLVRTSFNLNKTQVYYSYDESNIAENGLPLKTWGIRQSLQFPTVYGAQKRLRDGTVALSKQQYELDERLVKREVSKAYFDVLYWQNVVKNYTYLDSLYAQFSFAANRRYEVGETNYLEKLTAEAKYKEIDLLVKQSMESVTKSYSLLQQWMQSDSSFTIPDEPMPLLTLNEWESSSHPGVKYRKEVQNLSQQSLSLYKNQMLPNLQFGYFQGTNSGVDSRNYRGFEAGVAIPLWFGADRAKINAAKIGMTIAEYELENYEAQLISKYQSLLSDLRKYEEAIDYYNTTGKTLSEELIQNAQKAFRNGEIDFLQYVQLLENARNIEMGYLDNLYKYDKTVLEANYLLY